MIPEGVTIVEESAFCGCSSLTQVGIPSTLHTIKSNGFDGCSALESIIIPAHVTTFGDGVFASCNQLTIYGQTGSAAETYAIENGIPFIPME